MYRDYYYLTQSTISKVIGKALKVKDPIVLYTESEKSDFLEKLHRETSKLEHIRIDDFSGYQRFQNEPRTYYFHFTIISSFDYVSSIKLTIQTNNKHQLLLIKGGWGDSGYSISSADDIIKLRDAFVLEYAEADKRRINKKNNIIKSKKIKSIKYTAIIAKIEEIAKEEGFEYVINSSHATKVKLNIRLGKNNYLEINIPFASFQEVLLNTSKAWHAIKELTDNGVHIKLKNSQYASNWDWQQYTEEAK